MIGGILWIVTIFQKEVFISICFRILTNFFVKSILPKIQMLYSPNIQRSLSVICTWASNGAENMEDN